MLQDVINIALPPAAIAPIWLAYSKIFGLYPAPKPRQSIFCCRTWWPCPASVAVESACPPALLPINIAMPLFKSQAGDAAADLERQIGCVTGLFQMFDQQPRKQIAGPRNVSELPLSDVPQGEYLQSSDAKKVQESNGSMSSVGEMDTAASRGKSNRGANINGKESMGVFREKDRKTSKGKEKAPKTGVIVPHNSFQRRESEQPPHDANGMQITGGGISPKWSDAQSRSSLHAKGQLAEEERWEFWSAPLPKGGGGLAWRSETVDGMKAAWLANGGMVGERCWAAEDSLEDWKQSLRALARLQEEGERVGSAGGGYVAPRASPRSMGGGEQQAARVSSFDFKEAIRWSQRNSQEASRHSWDERDLPRSIAELRDAIHARFDKSSSTTIPPPPLRTTSCPPRRRPPNVVARLMGLDDLPKSALTEPPQKQPGKKSSGEAKLLQQLLQYTPPPPSPVEYPLPSTTVNPLLIPVAANSSDSFIQPISITELKGQGDAHLRAELQSVLKRLENLSLAGDKQRSNASAKIVDAMANGSSFSQSTNLVALKETKPQPLAQKQQIQECRPVVVLKQSEEMSSPLRSSYAFQDEIEKRLRQLGLQSSEQERKTLKQILEAMQLKGLLRPHKAKTADETRRQEVSNADETRRQEVSNAVSSVLEMPAPARLSSPARAPLERAVLLSSAAIRSDSQASHAIRPPNNDASASIVIMKPLVKSSSRVPNSVDHRRPGSGKCTAPSKAEKISQRKLKSSSSENSARETNGRKSRSLSSPAFLPSPQTPVQPRKLSLKIKQGQLQGVKSIPRVLSSSQGVNSRKCSSDAPSRRQAAPRKCCLEPVVAKSIDLGEIRPSKVTESCALSEAEVAHNSEVFTGDSLRETMDNSDCISDVTKATSVGKILEETIKELPAARTPPRESKTDQDFAEKVDILSEEIEQCSPVSVLEVHLSDNEVDVESPKFVAATGGKTVSTETQVDVSSCARILNEWQCPPEAAALQPTLPETNDIAKAPGDITARPACVSSQLGIASSTEFLYTEHIMRAAGLTESGADGMAARWLAGGCKIRPEVYDELEEHWDAAHAEEQEFEADDRDLGGELYRKSRQAAMRRRLVFDCLNQVLAGRLTWVEMPGVFAAASYRQLPVSQLWSDLQRLECRPALTPAAAEDSLYAMLEQDLSEDDAWRHKQSQTDIVARQLENSIFDSIVQEMIVEVLSP